MDPVSWKADQYAYIVRETMKWHTTGDTKILMTRLNTRTLSSQERVWLDELAKETGLVAFSGYDQSGPVTGYRAVHLEEKAAQSYVLEKTVKSLQEELYDCQAELLQEKEYVRILTETIYRIGREMKEEIKDELKNEIKK